MPHRRVYVADTETVTIETMTSKSSRDATRGPTLAKNGSDQQPPAGLAPPPESGTERTPDVTADTPRQSNDQEDVEAASDDKASQADSADYDTDLDVEGQSIE